jgi:uncharacterized protein involved in type VI secretion and phage assembly
MQRVASPKASTVRPRLHRTRRRQGMRCFTVRLAETKIESLVKAGYLDAHRVWFISENATTRFTTPIMRIEHTRRVLGD